MVFRASAGVLDRCADEITDLERDDFIRPVYNNITLNVGTVILNTGENGLLTFVIIIQIGNVSLIQRVYVQRVLKDFDDIRLVNDGAVREDLTPTEKVVSRYRLKSLPFV